jgi:hydrogenase expression/formation protein HypD
VANLYGRVVSSEGNRTAFALVEEFFEPADDDWRGFGTIPASGLALRPEWSHRDASTLEVEVPPPREPVGCRCGDVLRGAIDPPECPLFDAGCTPDQPVGACMVSSEGTCSAWFRHERWGAV